jgi:hypothetical protein
MLALARRDGTIKLSTNLGSLSAASDLTINGKAGPMLGVLACPENWSKNGHKSSFAFSCLKSFIVSSLEIYRHAGRPKPDMSQGYPQTRKWKRARSDRVAQVLTSCILFIGLYCKSGAQSCIRVEVSFGHKWKQTKTTLL